MIVIQTRFGRVLRRTFAPSLVESVMSYADLRVADLHATVLRGADLRHADCSEADFRNAVLCGANLSGADFFCARLDGADLRDATTCGATFAWAYYSLDTRWPEGFDPVAEGAELRECGS